MLNGLTCHHLHFCARERMSIYACEMVSAERPDLTTINLLLGDY